MDLLRGLISTLRCSLYIKYSSASRLDLKPLATAHGHAGSQSVFSKTRFCIGNTSG